jgi:hypothetical protein
VSKPKRYEYVSDGYTARFINPKTGHAAPLGEYVRYEDYARLKAECQARQAENSVLAVECDSLKTEVERLTKAGDAMASTLKDGGIIVSGYALADEWLKAKLLAAKGVQS